mmetsp:Transcript_16303/g.25836  ORF Transcript_16303/g.25836 Transcript_16303/m.25836 type:complete len:346 (+) Transcript_16303:492-1529(+)
MFNHSLSAVYTKTLQLSALELGKELLGVSIFKSSKVLTPASAAHSNFETIWGDLGENGARVKHDTVDGKKNTLALLISRGDLRSREFPLWDIARVNTTEGGVYGLLANVSLRNHPSTRLRTRKSRMLKPHPLVILGIFSLVNYETIRGVVEHPHDVPSDVERLSIMVLIPGTTADLRGCTEILLFEVDLPEHPAPVLAARVKVLVVCPGVFLVPLAFMSSDLAGLPGNTDVKRNLASNYLLTTTAVTVALNGVLATVVENDLFMLGGSDGRLHVDIIDNEVGVVPPVLFIGDVGGHVRWQDTVVVVVEVILRLMRGNLNVGQPLDHAATNESRDEHANRKSVIRG